MVIQNSNNVPQDVVDAANAVKNNLQTLDDLNPDAAEPVDPNQPAEG